MNITLLYTDLDILDVGLAVEESLGPGRHRVEQRLLPHLEAGRGHASRGRALASS